MILMNWFRRPRGLTLWLMSLSLLGAAGCARPDGLQSNARTDQHPVPFQNGEAAPSARQGASAAGQENPEAGLPFHDSQNLPAGTLLTVRLKNPIFAANPGANTTFEAVVDEPIVVEGNKLIPRGTTVTGRVESAQASNVRRDRGSVRLALDSIRVADRNLPIQTSSLFVRGNAGDTHAGDAQLTQSDISRSDVPQAEASTAVIRLEKGRRLTFRLTEPAYVAASQRTKVSH